MIKKLYTLALAVLMASFLIPFSANAGVAGSVKDQWYEPVTGSGSTSIYVAYTSDRSQSFKPKNDTIVSIDFYLKNVQNNSMVMLNVYSDKAKTNRVGRKGVILTNPPSEGWYTVAFDAPYVKVTPEQTYWFTLSCTDQLTQWAYNNGGYQRGEFELNPSNDALFRIFTIDPGSGSSTPSTPSTTTPSTTTDTGTTTPTTTTKTPKPNEETFAVLEIDETLEKPKVSEVRIHDQKVEYDVGGVLELEKDDFVFISGESFTGAEVVVFVGDNEYLAQIEEDGRWAIEFDANDYEEGLYPIRAQAIDDETGSEITDLFEVKVMGAKAEVVVQDVLKETDYTTVYVLIGVAAVVLAGSLGGGLYYYKKKKVNNKKEE